MLTYLICGIAVFAAGVGTGLALCCYSLRNVSLTPDEPFGFRRAMHHHSSSNHDSTNAALRMHMSSKRLTAAWAQGSFSVCSMQKILRRDTSQPLSIHL